MIPHIRQSLDEAGEKGRLEHFGSPIIQKPFAALMKAGNADAKPDEIDWRAVACNWELPIEGLDTRMPPRDTNRPSCSAQCKQCGHLWYTRAKRPRCSRCGTTHIELFQRANPGEEMAKC